MTDLWDEKPDKDPWASIKYPLKSDEEIKILVYDSAEMDAWLEKLKAHYKKADAVLSRWEEYFGEVTSAVKLSHDMNELKEKAEKLDTAFKTRDAAIHRTLVAEDKLEAVKTWLNYELNEVDKRRLHFMAYKLERVRHDRLLQLKKILEAEGL